MNLDTLQQRIRLGKDSTLELKRVEVSPAGKVTEPRADGLSIGPAPACAPSTS